MKQKRFANAMPLLIAAIICSVLGLGTAGCSGSQDYQAGSMPAADNPLASILPPIPQSGPPAVPATKAAGAAQLVTIDGSDDFAHSPAAAALGTSMELPSDFGAIEWAIYHNVGDGSALTGLEVDFALNSGTGAWLAVADYSALAWELHGPFASSPAMVDLSGGDYQSVGFDAYFVVIAFDGAFVTADQSTLTYETTPVAYNISGTVLKDGTTPLSGVTMTLDWATGGPTTALTNGSGEYTFSGLAPNRYYVTPELAGFDFTPLDQGVTIVDAGQSGVDFSATAQVVITYTADIQPLMALRCVSCHHAGGAAGGIQLDTYATTVAHATAANATIKDDSMPPGTPLTAEQKALFQAWLDAGKPE